jgi:hypothetical protein
MVRKDHFEAPFGTPLEAPFEAQGKRGKQGKHGERAGGGGGKLGCLEGAMLALRKIRSG